MASHSADTGFFDLDSPPRRIKKPSIVPVGLNFGPTSLSITFFFNQSEYYTGVSCGEVYRSFFQDSLNKKVQCNLECSLSVCSSTTAERSVTRDAKASDLVETFSQHIKAAMGMGVWSLDNNPALDLKLMAVTVPDHWGEAARTLVATATKLAGHPLDGSYMIIPLSRAIQSAFQLTRYTEGKYLTLLLDYNKSYLHLVLVEMCGTGCFMQRQIYFPHLGEDELHKATIPGSAVTSEQADPPHNVAKGEPSDGLQFDEASNSSHSTNISSGSDLMFPISDVHTSYFFKNSAPPTEQPTCVRYATDCSTSGTPIISHHTSCKSDANRTTVPDEFNGQRPVCHNKAAHFKPIIDTVSDFMIQTTATDMLKALKIPLSLKDAVRNVKYIVIDGEASIPGLWDLRDAIKSKFVNEEWITVEGNKRDCGAYGAALAARRQLQNPKHLGDWKDLPGYVPGRVR